MLVLWRRSSEIVKRGKSTRSPTPEEAERMHRLSEMPCIACEVDGHGFVCGPTTIHHIVNKSYRKHSGGHMATLNLGVWHHLGRPLDGHNERQMRAIFGPSLELEKRAFNERYHGEQALLVIVNKRLGKCVP